MLAQRPRILFVLPATVLGGAEIRLLNMLGQFKQIEAVLLSHQEMVNRCPEGILALSFEDYRDCIDPYPFNWRNACIYARAIAKVGNQLRADLVFGWMHNGSVFTALAGTLFGLRSCLVGSVLGPVSAHYHFHRRSPTAYERAILVFAFRRLRGLVVNSDGARQDLIDRWYVPSRRVHRIYNGIDLSQVRTTAEQGNLKADAEIPIVLTASRLSLEKGFDVQLEAFARVRQVVKAKFLILGEGPLRPQIENWIMELDLLDDVKLLGFQNNPFIWMKGAAAFLMASRLEGFPNALVEAMSLGLPVVSTACPYGPREIIGHGESGLLAPVDDDEALANHLLRVLQDAEYAGRLGEGARKRAQVFTMSAMIESYERLILNCLKN